MVGAGCSCWGFSRPSRLISSGNSLHEPELFVKKSHDRPKESALHLLALEANVETTKLSIGMVILTSVQNFGYYGVMIWLPSYLSSRFGFALTQSAVWTW